MVTNLAPEQHFSLGKNSKFWLNVNNYNFLVINL